MLTKVDIPMHPAKAKVLLASALFGATATAQAATVFKHIIFVIQENRTPDNLFGSFPKFEHGVDVQPAGVNSLGKTIPLTAEVMAGCYDISHAHSAFEAMLNEGADQEPINGDPGGCTIPANPQFKYVDNSTGEVQPYFDIATNYGFANRMFQTQQGPSFPAHQFLFAGTSAPSTDSPLFASENMFNEHESAGCIAPADQTVKLIDPTGSETSNAPIYPCFEHPTMGDLLDRANISWRYYAPTPGSIWTAPNSISHMCGAAVVGGVLQCEGKDWTNGSLAPYNPALVLSDIQQCSLAAVSWVIPTGDESDHATITDGTGPAWVASIVNTLGEQPTCEPSGENYWKDTAILITWDDWGGWFDHVKPPMVKVQPTSPPAWGDGYVYGFRVPLLVVSAYTPAGYVDNDTHDFGSMLYFAERNFRLGFIGPGNTIYSNYDDYQDATRGDDLEKFFPLATPKPFVPIPSPQSAAFFLNRPLSSAAPDND
jgi:phospholipase C